MCYVAILTCNQLGKVSSYSTACARVALGMLSLIYFTSLDKHDLPACQSEAADQPREWRGRGPEDGGPASPSRGRDVRQEGDAHTQAAQASQHH